MFREKLREIRQELRLIVTGNGRFVEALLPLGLFLVLLKPAGTVASAGVSFVCGIVLAVRRFFPLRAYSSSESGPFPLCTAGRRRTFFCRTWG